MYNVFRLSLLKNNQSTRNRILIRKFPTLVFGVGIFTFKFKCRQRFLYRISAIGTRLIENV